MSEITFYHVMLAVSLTSALITLPILLFVSAPYGRHERQGWGPRIGATLGWISMEAPAPLLFALFFSIGDRRDNLPALVFLLLWEMHYIHRAFVFPFRRRGGGKLMPLAIAGSAFAFNLMNGYLQGRGLNRFVPLRPVEWLVDPRFLAGTALFVAGLAINLRSDAILFLLRRPGQTGYSIPRGGLYRWVSCPNYLGETVEWTGWAIATWSRPGLVFAVWTAANLLPRALSHHRWYQRQFADYPAGRKALIPFLL
jgi:3-oxo-5-alpha-steroid 4-dehydrogenase 1